MSREQSQVLVARDRPRVTTDCVRTGIRKAAVMALLKPLPPTDAVVCPDGAGSLRRGRLLPAELFSADSARSIHCLATPTGPRSCSPWRSAAGSRLQLTRDAPTKKANTFVLAFERFRAVFVYSSYF
jgi:hypothetical protein